MKDLFLSIAGVIIALLAGYLIKARKERKQSQDAINVILNNVMTQNKEQTESKLAEVSTSVDTSVKTELEKIKEAKAEAVKVHTAVTSKEPSIEQAKALPDDVIAMMKDQLKRTQTHEETLSNLR